MGHVGHVRELEIRAVLVQAGARNLRQVWGMELTLRVPDKKEPFE
jgi:hypothetical protein